LRILPVKFFVSSSHL